jgi:nicotinamidase/pyrazinamidase
MKTIFWNVDTQYDFMRNDDSFRGKLAIPGARAIEGNLERLTGLAKAKNLQVVNTADWHNNQTAEIAEKPDFMQTFPEHCMQNTEGARFVPATEPENPYVIDWQAEGFEKKKLDARNIVLYKDKFDIFAGNKYAEDVLKAINPKRAIVYGVATNVCVDFAVMGLLERNVQVYVPIDAIKELPGLPLPYEKWEKKGAIFTKVDELNYDLRGAK